jgi:ketosteroid isomerase-like protein
MTDAGKIETLVTRQEIADAIYRYARGIDRLDFDLVRSCYHPDAYDDHGSFAGTVEEFIAAAKNFLPQWTATQHFMGNMLIEIEGESACAETYAVAYHRREDEDGNGKDDIMGIRYVDRFEKRDGAWKIAHRVVSTEWRRVDPVSRALGRGKIGVWGQRDDGDVINWIMSASAPAEATNSSD